MLRTGDHLFSVLRRMLAWAEACPCHGDLDWNEVPKSQRDLWAACPLRGRRLPELAEGALLKLLDETCERTAAELFTGFPAALADEDKSTCIRDFEAGRSHLVFMLNLKLAYCSQPPFVLHGAAHHCRSVASDCLRRCLASSCQHKKIQDLQTPPLQQQAEMFCAGATLTSLPELEFFIASLKFGYAAERRVESGHARVHRQAGISPNRTEAFDSLSLRMGSLRAALEEDFTGIADCFALCCHPRAAVESLGLHSNPVLRDLFLDRSGGRNWSVLFRKVVYHADSYVLYHAPLPILKDSLLPGGGGESDGDHDCEPDRAQCLVGMFYKTLVAAAALEFVSGAVQDGPTLLYL